jgi:hypothetical protein
MMEMIIPHFKANGKGLMLCMSPVSNTLTIQVFYSQRIGNILISPLYPLSSITFYSSGILSCNPSDFQNTFITGLLAEKSILPNNFIEIPILPWSMNIIGIPLCPRKAPEGWK